MRKLYIVYYDDGSSMEEISDWIWSLSEDTAIREMSIYNNIKDGDVKSVYCVPEAIHKDDLIRQENIDKIENM